MPPKQSDLWRIANKLHLYGEEWDEDEQKAISEANKTQGDWNASLD